VSVFKVWQVGASGLYSRLRETVLRATRLDESLRKKLDGERSEVRAEVRTHHCVVTFDAGGDVRTNLAIGDEERDIKMWWLRANPTSLPASWLRGAASLNPFTKRSLCKEKMILMYCSSLKKSSSVGLL
jgi:hypothetical protein